MVRLLLHPFQLPLRHVFTISRGSMSVYRGLLVELEHDGCRGYGEAGESDYYGTSIAAMTAELERLRGPIEAWQPGDPAELWQQLDPQLHYQRFVQAALDIAAHDLYGKLCGQPVWQLWELDLAHCPVTDYTLGIDRPEVMLAKMREFPDWPVYKIKLGRADDVQIVRELRRWTSAAFRVDANAAWTVAETLEKAPKLAELGVQYIEQPLPPEDWAGMRVLHSKSALPLLADESCRVEADVDRCAEHFHGINVKLVKCGGLTPARRMLLRARQLDLQTMIGCMTESTVGISAAAQLLPLVDYADLDGPLILADDLASGVKIEQGRVIFSSQPGCGVQLLRSW